MRLGLARAFDPDGDRLVYYGTLQWNIPLGEFLSGGGKKQYDAMIKANNIRLNDMRNTIRQEILNAYAQLRMSRQNKKMAEEAVGFSEEALSQSIQRQRMGTALALEVFNAQEQLIDAKLEYINALKNYNQSQYNLYISLGNKL